MKYAYKTSIFAILIFFAWMTFGAPAPWDPATIYTEGDSVTHEDNIFVALWWTQNQEPDPDYPYGPWEHVDLNPDGTIVWSPSKKFRAGDLVVYNDKIYKAKWETRGQNPEDGGPWEYVEDYEPDVIVPITLMQFSASCNEDLVSITWSTASEVNNHFFSILASSDGLIWVEQARIEPKETPNEKGVREYRAELERSAGFAYYRLRQTDHDGTSEEFQAVAVSCETGSGTGLRTFPNPSRAMEAFHISGRAGKTTRVFDQSGRLIEENTKGEGLPPGHYIIMAEDGRTTRHVVQ